MKSQLSTTTTGPLQYCACHQTTLFLSANQWRSETQFQVQVTKSLHFFIRGDSSDSVVMLNKFTCLNLMAFGDKFGIFFHVSREASLISLRIEVYFSQTVD